MLPPTVLAALGTRLCAVRGAWAWRLRAEQLAGKEGLVAWCPHAMCLMPMRPAGLLGAASWQAECRSRNGLGSGHD